MAVGFHPVEIRRARVADAGGIARVLVRGWQAGYAHIMPSRVLDAMNVEERKLVFEQTLLDASLPHEMWVGLCGGAFAGWMSHGPSRDGGAGPATGEVQGLYVDPEWWGAGIGGQLLARALQRMAGQGMTQVTLWVLEANARAIRFYKSNGFQDDGARQFYTGQGMQLPKIRMFRDV